MMVLFGCSRQYVWILLLLLSSFISSFNCLMTTTTEQQLELLEQQLLPKVYNLPYAIGFYFLNESLPESTCRIELDNVTAAVYPTYEQDIMTDSIMTLDIINKIKLYATNNKKRQLIRSSSSRHHSLSISSSDDENKQGQQHKEHRQLQSWCYTICSQKPKEWLILNGCGTECGIKRRRKLHDDDNDIYHNRNVIELSSLDTVRLMANDEYYTKSGTGTALLPGQGDLSASLFYWKVREMIPTSDPCRNLLLTMTYKRIPLVINIP